MITKLLIGTIIGIFGLVTICSAVTLTYETVSTDGGPSAGIFYSLTFDQTGLNTYGATFSITTPGGSFPTDWWAGWFTFKFVEGNQEANLNLLTSPAGSGPWTAIPPPVSVYGGTNIGQGGRSGFYVTSLFVEDGQLPFPYNQLILLTSSNSIAYNFTFDFYTPLPVFTDEIPFQVGYYDGLTGQERVITNRLSVNLVSVPEPSTLLLLGSGLVGVWFYRRRFNRSA